MMRVYLHDEKTGGKIAKLCDQAGLSVLTHEEVLARDATPAGVSFFLEEVDALVMEITQPTQQIHFILAQAILADKPALCLYAKNQTPRELLSYIKKRPAPRPIKTFSYTGSTLPLAVKSFVASHSEEEQDGVEDVPSIKYTLRMSPKIDRYLKWVHETRGVNKADFMREMLLKLSIEDEAYQEDEEQAGLQGGAPAGDS